MVSKKTAEKTAKKAGFTLGYVAIAALAATRIPWLKDLPPELVVPVLAGLINAVKNILKHHFGFDIFRNK